MLEDVFRALVSTALARRDASTALAMYLTANPGVPRTDVQLNSLVVRDLRFPRPCACRCQDARGQAAC
jgi:hypothetical protein